MKDLIETVKSITTQQWLNVIFGGVLLFGYQNYTKRIERLEENIEVARKGKDKIFELYLECINEKTKK
jgi:hypothetical protein